MVNQRSTAGVTVLHNKVRPQDCTGDRCVSDGGAAVRGGRAGRVRLSALGRKLRPAHQQVERRGQHVQGDIRSVFPSPVDVYE